MKVFRTIYLVLLLIVLPCSILHASVFTDEVRNYILSKHKLASEVSSKGKTLKISIMFQNNKSTDTIHDPEIIAMAKKHNIKRIEFHDWAGFARGHISTNIR